MADHFATLHFAPSAALDDDAVQTAYHAACRAAGESVESVNEAYEVLRSPVKRLKHLLEIHQQDGWKSVVMADDLMAVFSRLGPLLQKVQDFSKRNQSASSALSKALLAPDAMALQEEAAEIANDLQALLDTKLDELPALDAAIATDSPEAWQRVHQAQAHLAYLTKWQTQVREALLVLMQV